MGTLRNSKPVLTTINTRELLDDLIVDHNHNLPGRRGVESRLFDGHILTVASPIFRINVYADRPKSLYPAIALEVHQAVLRGAKNFVERPTATPIQTDFPVGLGLGQLMPSRAAQQVEIRQTALPAVKLHQPGFAAAVFDLLDHVLKMVFLVQAVLELVMQSEIARQPIFLILPNQRNQVDPVHRCMMLARPVSTDRLYLRRIRIVQRTVVEHQHNSTRVHQPLNFLPKRLTVQRQALQLGWMSIQGVNAAKYLLCCN